ncbi:MAG TPA: 4'-phosphopantetheinyl transferase superfamily protein [Allosphingosinicella sp.]|jgi:4'-phosphopantetheinyl transferase
MRRSPPFAPPAADEVCLYLLETRPVTPAMELELLSLLDAPERARRLRFVHPADRFTHLMAHALLQRVLRAATARPMCSLRRDASGKPHLDPPPARPLCFNLTHTEGLVACATARVPVGVDAEFIVDDKAWMQIARRFFSPLEVSRLAGLTGKDLARQFFAIWTLKEAIVKAAGCGITIPLERFSVDPSSSPQNMVTDLAMLAGGWWLDRISLRTHEVAVAIRAEASSPVRLKTILCVPGDIVDPPDAPRVPYLL